MSGIWAQHALYNRLANETLYEACATLSDEARRRDLGAFFRSVHGNAQPPGAGQTHHRAQVHTMLSQLGQDPPVLDLHRVLRPNPA